MQKELLTKGDGRDKKVKGLQVPKYIQSSKHIMAEKKVAQAGLNVSTEGKGK
jgi:hypothetical protein|tara:strand:- start:47 stop:202 length:156 start_codon:yes stop_codon:yes gene_type:complete